MTNPIDFSKQDIFRTSPSLLHVDELQELKTSEFQINDVLQNKKDIEIQGGLSEDF